MDGLTKPKNRWIRDANLSRGPFMKKYIEHKTNFFLEKK